METLIIICCIVFLAFSIGTVVAFKQSRKATTRMIEKLSAIEEEIRKK